VISAKVVTRATVNPVCEALLLALGTFGVPEQILTHNGKVFAGHFGPRSSGAQLMFDPQSQLAFAVSSVVERVRTGDGGRARGGGTPARIACPSTVQVTESDNQETPIR
jgi:hypothetical protein